MSVLRKVRNHPGIMALLLCAGLMVLLNPGFSSDFSVCEYALVQCFGDASVMDWLTKAVIGHAYYCLNGYSFCKVFLEPLMDR